MDEDHRLERELGHLSSDRRTFIKRMAAATVFATPIISSFSMSGLRVNSAAAQVSNGSPVP
jgi:hypothetical protein